MNSLAAAYVVLLAAGCSFPVRAFQVLVNEYFNDNIPLIEAKAREGTCIPPMEPFFVDFEHQDNCYLLWVSEWSINAIPDVSLDDHPKGFGDSTNVYVYGNIIVSNYTVNYKACVGIARGHVFNSNQCDISATNTGAILSTSASWVRNNNGASSDPATNYTLIDHTVDIKTFGKWHISASCPGVDRCLVNEMVNAIRRVFLVSQRHFVCATILSCSGHLQSQLSIDSYITE